MKINIADIDHILPPEEIDIFKSRHAAHLSPYLPWMQEKLDDFFLIRRRRTPECRMPIYGAHWWQIHATVWCIYETWAKGEWCRIYPYGLSARLDDIRPISETACLEILSTVAHGEISHLVFSPTHIADVRHVIGPLYGITLADDNDEILFKLANSKAIVIPLRDLIGRTSPC